MEKGRSQNSCKVGDEAGGHNLLMVGVGTIITISRSRRAIYVFKKSLDPGAIIFQFLEPELRYIWPAPKPSYEPLCPSGDWSVSWLVRLLNFHAPIGAPLPFFSESNSIRRIDNK